jgi:hypothetical protein
VQLHFAYNRIMNRCERDAHCEEIEARFSDTFRRIEGEEANSKCPVFEHLKYNIAFRFIPGGEFSFGLSKEEEEVTRKLADPPPLNLDEMQPSAWVKVPPFLMSMAPITVAELRKTLGKGADLPSQVTINGEDFPAYVDRKLAVATAKAARCRLPYEIEWEYACRAGTQSAFVWGDRLPDTSELEQWLDLRSASKENEFGLKRLFAGDWCQDHWRSSHLPNAPVSKDSFVIKGGGSFFWPWQADEWVWCLPSMRMPSTDLLDGRCAFRLLFPLEDSKRRGRK